MKMPIRKNIKAACVLVLLLLCASTAYAQPPKRIISLAPSMTEILYALGLQERIVGVTMFCDYPPEAKLKPKIGGMSNPSLEAVVRLAPDLVMMTTDGNPSGFKDRLDSLGIKSYVFTARRISELPDALRKAGAVLGAKTEAEALAQSLEHTMFELKAAKRPKPNKVLYVIWPEPLIVAGPGTAVDDAITLLGYVNASGARTSYPKYSAEEVIRRNPDYIFIGLGKGMDELSKKFLKTVASTNAVKNNKVFIVSDQLYRLGPRIPAGIRELYDALQKGDEK